MVGRLRPDVVADEEGAFRPEWGTWLPGDYGWIIEPRMGRTLYVCDPNGNIGWIGKHTVTEHEDGTITLSPSVLFDRGPRPWHGWLQRGIWTTAGDSGSAGGRPWTPSDVKNTLGWRKP